VLGAAADEFDAIPRLARARRRVLFVLSTSDALFPPSLAPGRDGPRCAAPASRRPYHDVAQPVRPPRARASRRRESGYAGALAEFLELVATAG